MCVYIYIYIYNQCLSVCSSSSRVPSTSPSAHSISSVTPDRTRFPRGTSSRSTFHGAQLRDRRSATYNGPPASPTLSHDTGALAQARRGTSSGFISKITSKFVRRSVYRSVTYCTSLHCCLCVLIVLTLHYYLIACSLLRFVWKSGQDSTEWPAVL